VRLPTRFERQDVLEQIAEARDGDFLRVGRSNVRVTHLDRVLWPSTRPRVTKRDLLAYLVHVAPAMLVHAAGRPAFVTRSPEGLSGDAFYQKVWETPPSFVKRLDVWSSEHDGPRPLLLIDNMATLLWLAQQGVMEYHVWLSRTSSGDDVRGVPTDYASSRSALLASRLNYPDVLAVDLDAYAYSGKEAPGAEPELHRKGFARVRDVALQVRQLAEALGLTAFVKTSGKTGLHVFLPLRRLYRFEEVRAMAQTLADFLRRLRPDDVTVAWAVKERSGRVFVDANQNARGKSLVLAYSPRRHAKATVSMPLSWESLATAYPTDFTVHSVPSILEVHGDCWSGIDDHKGDLRAVLDVAS
jgi:bifunctional non-homologous end joining protein LigD